MLDHRPGPAARYGAALLAVALAVAARAILGPVLGDQFPFATLYFAVLAAALYGGSGPAAVAVVAGAVSAAVFLLPSRTFAADGWDQRVGLALFLITGAGIAALGGVMRAARSRAEASAGAAHGQRELLHATLVGIGDGVIATDAGGRVTFLNPVAEVLTGWPQAAAAGEPLERVFRIVNEETRKPVENPALRALRGGPHRRAGEPHRPDLEGRGRAAHRRQRRPDPGARPGPSPGPSSCSATSPTGSGRRRPPPSGRGWRRSAGTWASPWPGAGRSRTCSGAAPRRWSATSGRRSPASGPTTRPPGCSNSGPAPGCTPTPTGRTAGCRSGSTRSARSPPSGSRT